MEWQAIHEAIPDRVRPMSEQYFSLQCMIDGETEGLLKRAQDLLSQNQSKAVSMGDLDQRSCERLGTGVSSSVGPQGRGDHGKKPRSSIALDK